MKIKSILLFSALINSFSMLSQDQKTNMNPFFENYSTPFQVPPFHLIKNEHFKSAILEGIKIQENEIKNIVSNKFKPTFDNTILAFENSGKLLSKVNTVFYNLNSANTNDEIQMLAKELAPKLATHNDNIYLNEELFQKVKHVWENQLNFNLNKEQVKILENILAKMLQMNKKDF